MDDNLEEIRKVIGKYLVDFVTNYDKTTKSEAEIAEEFFDSFDPEHEEIREKLKCLTLGNI